MKRTLAIVSAFGLSLAMPALAGSALAQASTTPSPSTGATPPTSRSDTMTSLPGTGTAEVKGNKLIGADVKGPDNEKIGDVSEVLVSTEGKVNAIIVSVGGFLGVGDRQVALPWEQLRFSSEGNDLIVMSSATKDALKAMPEYQDPAKAQDRSRMSNQGQDSNGSTNGMGSGARDTSRPMRPAPSQ